MISIQIEIEMNTVKKNIGLFLIYLFFELSR